MLEGELGYFKRIGGLCVSLPASYMRVGLVTRDKTLVANAHVQNMDVC